MSLNTKTVLVSLNIAQWTAQKYDKAISDEVNENHGAAKDATRVNKHLLHKDALKSIQGVISNARTYHYANTLDWNEASGTRILPVKKIPAYTAYMRNQRQEFDESVEAFIRHYPTYIEYARKRLGDMFCMEDFLEAEDIKNRFRFEHRITPVPSEGDFRVDIPQDQLETIQHDLKARVRFAELHAQNDLWSRTTDVLGTLYDTLRNPGKRVYNSTVHDNIVILLEQIASMNFNDDAELNMIAALIERDLTHLSSTLIRKDDAIRSDALRKTDAIIRCLPTSDAEVST